MKKILVVDDNEDMLMTVEQGLKSIAEDYEITTVNSGQKALDKLKKDKYDLVLLDIMMPEMDGWKVAAKIKDDDNMSDVPIIFLTGKTDNLSKGMGSLTAEDYIEKPFELEDLKNRIDKVL
ncbi:MAG: response regulator [Nanobdellota archaeon]